ncbi:MAG: ABC transporter permease [Clostridia bacterium]|nr:ABC transporter permease [Clostridia bacterium]
MRMLALASRNQKELLRDPLTLIFGVGFPLVLLILMTIIENSVSASTGISVPQFELQNLLPGLLVFGLSFLCLFCGMLLAGDRESSFLMRLFASPLTALDYLSAYALPILAVAVAQSLICLGAGLLLGAEVSLRLILLVLALLPSALLFIAIGLLFGTLFTYKQVGGVSSIVVNVAAWLSGTWFELKLVGGVFERICYYLPFAHAVELAKKAYAGAGDITVNLLCVLGYALAVFALAGLMFRRRMKQ